jgi:hypothetical protein
MPSTISFPMSTPQWVVDRNCIAFYAIADKSLLKCVISAEALEARFGAKGLGEREAMRAFMENRGIIESVAREVIDAGQFNRGDEVVLRIRNFATVSKALSISYRTENTTVNISPDIKDPALLSGITKANSVLNEDFARGRPNIKVVWNPLPPVRDLALVQLTLTDLSMNASVQGLFTSDDLEDLPFARFALFRLWDDLLRERGMRQREAIDVNEAVGV